LSNRRDHAKSDSATKLGFLLLKPTQIVWMLS
jgi:hypothetical protein